MGSSTSRVLASFSATGTGIADLTRAQLEVWQTMRDNGMNMDIEALAALMELITVEAAFDGTAPANVGDTAAAPIAAAT